MTDQANSIGARQAVVLMWMLCEILNVFLLSVFIIENGIMETKKVLANRTVQGVCTRLERKNISLQYRMLYFECP